MLDDDLADDDPSHDDVHFFMTIGGHRLSGWRYVPDLSLWVCLGEVGDKHKPIIATYNGETFDQWNHYGIVRN